VGANKAYNPFDKNEMKIMKLYMLAEFPLKTGEPIFRGEFRLRLSERLLQRE